MRIIKRGTPADEVEIKKTCKKCYSEFMITLSDIKFDRDGSYVECPVCSKEYHRVFISASSSEFYENIVLPDITE